VRARLANAPYASIESLLEALAKIRRATVIRQTTDGSKHRLTTQLEDMCCLPRSVVIDRRWLA
jgi:hypothetical protein